VRTVKTCVLCCVSHDGDGDDYGVRWADTAWAHTRWWHIGFAWSHRYAQLGDVPRTVSPRRHGLCNRHQICYIVNNRVANKWINSLTINGFSYIASTTPPPDPFGRGYAHPIGRIHWCCKPSDQPRDAARREECSSLDEMSFTTFCRCDGRAKGIC